MDQIDTYKGNIKKAVEGIFKQTQKNKMNYLKDKEHLELEEMKATLAAYAKELTIKK